MPQPRKYKTDAERFRAYRERKREKEEALRREVYLQSARAERARKKAGAPVAVSGSDALRQEFLELRKKIPPRRHGAGSSLGPNQWVLDWIEMEMDRILGLAHHPYQWPPAG